MEITVHIIPRENVFENINLASPVFHFECVEPEEVGKELEQKLYSGVGTNLPDRIFIMNNRDYNLGVANHADKWAVFWLFTAAVSCFPRFLERTSERSHKRMIKRAKEEAERE